MKLIEKDSIVNIAETDLFDGAFLFPKNTYLSETKEIQVISLWELLKKCKNDSLEQKLWDKPAMYSNMYSADDEFNIFKSLFDSAIKNKKKIHIVWITLLKEIEILEKYYESLGFMREDINCFRVDFSVPLVTVSAKIENLIWKWSDYKRKKKDIFFMPPVRESSQNKALFKWINRWVIAWLHINSFWKIEEHFLTECITQEKILPLTLGKVLYYNLEEIWIAWEKQDLKITYE